MERVKKMKLIIGGTAQGKLEYVLLKYDVHKKYASFALFKNKLSNRVVCKSGSSPMNFPVNWEIECCYFNRS